MLTFNYSINVRRSRITCTLWEGFYEQLLTYIKYQSADEHVIIILDYAKIQSRGKGLKYKFYMIILLYLYV